MREFRYFALAGLALVPAAAALASDQPGTAADQWKEELSGQVAWQESLTDAGKFPADANLTRGGGPLNRITGQMTRLRDVDMFCIDILDPVAFSAVVVGGNTTLSLFTTSGVGIAFNDEDPLGGTGARLTNTFTSSLSPGLYMIAIGRISTGSGGIWNYPMDAANNSIFHTVPPTVRNVEYGANLGVGPLDHWNYNSTGFEPFNFNYTITMTGVGYHMLPAPGASALLALGCLPALRRRR